jgi:pilus assembly protein CpaF
MFRNFSRPAEVSPRSFPSTPPPRCRRRPRARPAAEPRPVVTESERDLLKRLELKGRLHDAVLERLNLNVIEKVDADDLRREVTALVNQVLATENTPLPSAEFKLLVDELLHEVMGLGRSSPCSPTPPSTTSW